MDDMTAVSYFGCDIYSKGSYLPSLEGNDFSG